MTHFVSKHYILFHFIAGFVQKMRFSPYFSIYQ